MSGGLDCLMMKKIDRLRGIVETGGRKRLSARQVMEEGRAIQRERSGWMSEGMAGSISRMPLEAVYSQYLRRGERLTPVGKVTLEGELAPCPYLVGIDGMTGEVFFERMRSITDDILVFENSVLQEVVREVDKFWSRKPEFDKLKLMHNRGLIMYGPPGTGKSIALQQVTEMMAARGDPVFFVKSPGAIREGASAVRQIEPDRKITVVFEEAEEMCAYNEGEMLRLLDGDAKIQGVCYLATTNYLHKMPPRMLRPGRFDKRIFVGFPTQEHRKVYLESKLKKQGLASDVEIQEMVEKTEGMGFGHLRELIAGVYALGETLESVLARMKEDPHSKDSRPVFI